MDRKEYRKQYYEEHKDEIKAYNKTYGKKYREEHNHQYICECGSLLGKRYKENHEKSTKHHLLLHPIGLEIEIGQKFMRILWEDDEMYYGIDRFGEQWGMDKNTVLSHARLAS